MKPSSRACGILAGALLFDLASITLAHSHGGDMTMDMNDSIDQPEISRPTISAVSSSTDMGPPSYFRHSEYSGLMLAHIVLMSVAWAFVLPLSLMLSIAQSRLSLLTQFSFLVVNGLGALLMTIYNSNTPDLYPNNAHHTFGWLLTWVVCAQTCMAVLRAYTGMIKDTHHLDERAALIPISTHAMKEHQRISNHPGAQDHRFSHDSGHGTERNTESLRSQSMSSVDEDSRNQDLNMVRVYEAVHETAENPRVLANNTLDKFLTKKLPWLLSSRTLCVLEFVYETINRLLLILGFVALTTGIATYGGIFRGDEIFSGLAHFIKGGVFFWYGILTLGRWAGCFADLGWAWNIKPSKSIVGSRKASIPSAEFVESFLIFFYGITNVFLEHLGSWGQEWSAQDLEHVSITIMFFGGGLCGMLIESNKIREMLNATIAVSSPIRSSNLYIEEGGGERNSWRTPRSYRFSMNPLPALIVLLLGLMMSSHHQASMVSTMIHKQWGTLLVGAAVARAVTYIIFYLSPPTSLLPSRPPSELITAFCLIAGGFIFMASSHDTVAAMEFNDLNAMFVFTVAMGLVTFLMAWIILVIAIKGWAVRREHRHASTSIPIS